MEGLDPPGSAGSSHLVIGSFLGMALPCMLSLEFIRNAPISGNRVGAMVADGLASRHPDFGYILWPLTLLISFLVLAPNQIHSGDNIARRWTDIIWTVSSRARTLGGNQVKFIYYGILLAYGVWGLFALSLFDPLQIAKVGTVLMNVALGASSLHVLYINHSLLPPEVRPGLDQQDGPCLLRLFFSESPSSWCLRCSALASIRSHVIRKRDKDSRVVIGDAVHPGANGARLEGAGTGFPHQIEQLRQRRGGIEPLGESAGRMTAGCRSWMSPAPVRRPW